MKLRKLLSAVAACAVAASALSVSSFASVFECKLAEGGNGGPAVYMFPSEEAMGVKIDDIESVKFYTVSTTDYFKGVIGGNINGSWTVTPEKEFDIAAGVTEVKDIPDFENDGNMQFQCWWMNPGSIEFTKVEMLDASGKVLYTDGETASAPVEDTTKAEPVTVKIAYTDGKTPSYTYKVGAGVKDLKVKVAMTGNVEWNDWCGAGVVVTDAKGSKTYYQWGGAQVTWGWDADDDKVDDSKDGVKGSTWVGTIGTDGGEISVPVSDGATVEFYCLSWDSQPSVDQYTLTFDAPSAEETKADDTKKDETPVEPTEETEDVSSEETADVSSEETADVSSEETADVSSEDVSSEETAEDNSAWEEAVANASKDIADYLDVNASNKTLFLKYDDGKVGYADAAGIDIASITGVKFHVTFDELEVADESVWIGGGIGANSNSTSWLQNEWGRNEKPIIPDFENGTITWDNGAPIFSADDKYAQLWVCSWGGSFAVDSVELLFADNGDASADDTKTDDTKGSPDTGVAGVAVAAGVVALAGAAVVVSRKRK